MATLTFDDGPSEWTPAILDHLADHQAHAMFFATGQQIFGRADILKRAHAEGHTIGNHGYTHTRLTTLDDHDVRMELLATSELIELITGERPSLFRAPYFDADERVLAIAGEQGLAHMGASVIPEDWSNCDAAAIARVVLTELRPASVVSLHDGIPPRGGSEMCTDTRQPTVDAVRLILEGMAA